MASKILTITDISSTGEGIAKEDGKVYFIKGAIPQQTVEASIVEEKKRFSRGITLSVVEDAIERPVICTETECGGCMMQGIPYTEQLSYKNSILQNAFLKIAGIQDISLLPIVPSPLNVGYRTKVEFSFGYTKEGTATIGFHSWKDASIVPIQTCVMATEGIEHILNIARTAVETSAQKPYQKGHGFWRYLVVRYSVYEKKYLIHCITDALVDGYAEVKALGEALQEVFSNATFIHSIRTSRYPVAYGERYISIKGEKSLQEVLQIEGSAITLNYGANSFFQVNHSLVEGLYSFVREQTTENASMLDMCCGVGSIALCCASKASTVVGIDLEKEAISFAKENATKNVLENAQFSVVKMSEVQKKLLVGIDEICVDPPRGGLDAECITSIIGSEAKKLIYVSCNPATLARDCKLLEEHFTVEQSRAFDMFPHTPHCESITILKKRY